MLEIIRTDSQNPHFQLLVAELDKLLAVLDGEDHSFYAQFNKIDSLNHVLVAYVDGFPAGCGAIKQYEEKTAEIKRMFVGEKYRGQGIASQILTELEIWAKELGFNKAILETGDKQKAAIGLYSKSNYEIIPNFGQYKDVENSICFQKILQ